MPPTFARGAVPRLRTPALPPRGSHPRLSPPATPRAAPRNDRRARRLPASALPDDSFPLPPSPATAVPALARHWGYPHQPASGRPARTTSPQRLYLFARPLRAGTGPRRALAGKNAPAPPQAAARWAGPARAGAAPDPAREGSQTMRRHSIHASNQQLSKLRDSGI